MNKDCYVPAMFDYQRVDAIELFISICAPLRQSGQVMSSYVKLSISFPIFSNILEIGWEAILRTADWVRSEAGMSLKLGMAFSHGGYMGEMWAIVCNCSWEKGWKLINYEI